MNSSNEPNGGVLRPAMMEGAVGATDAGALQSARAILSARMRGEPATIGERDWLQVTLASIGDALISTDVGGRVTFMNPVAEALTGWTRAEAVGHPLPAVFRILDEHTREPVDNPALRAIVEGRVVGRTDDTLLIARDGTTRPIDDSTAPIRDDSGAPIGAVLVFRDVSGRRAAEEAQARLAAIVESSEDAIVSKSLDGIIRTWNAGAEQLFGYTADEVIGRSITIIIPSERLAEEYAILERLVRGERVQSFETVRVTRDGRMIDISLTVSPVRDAHGHIIGASKVGRDISERKRAEQALADSARREREQGDMLRQVADASLAIHAAGSIDRVLAVVAEEARRILDAERGYSSLTEGDDLAQVSVTAALGEAHAGAPEQGLPPDVGDLQRAVCSANQPLRSTQGHPGDPRRPQRGWLAAPFIGHSGKNLGLVQLVDKRRGEFTDSDEAMLVQLAHIASVALENGRLYAALREQDRRKDEYLALLAHELRNPLAPIRNGLQILRLASDRAVREQAQDMMDRQLGHMVRLVDDLLDISRISRNKLELRRSPVLLAEAVNSAVEAVRPLLDAARHDLEVALPPEPVVLDGDLTRLAQIFSNLLTNSIKYTDPGGRIRLGATHGADEVTITVHDSGIGIPQDALPLIFDMFSQADRTLEGSRGGLGIGLALVKGLVEMHGGTIAAVSPGPGQGSTFTVRLPLWSHPAETASAAETSSSRRERLSGPRRRILVVDDNHDAAETMATVLELLGDEVRTAHDGLAAVVVAEQFRPAAILMDIGMPGMNGYDATRRIREQAWGKHTRIIALTGWGQDHDRARSRAAGCDAHLVKPVSPEDLEQALTGLGPAPS